MCVQLLTGIQPLTLPHFEDLKEKDSVSNRCVINMLSFC